MDEERAREGAKILAFRIAKEALEDAQEFLKKYQELILEKKKKTSKEKLNNLYCQFALLYYHITDRIGIRILEPANRQGFMMNLWLYLWTDHIKLQEFSRAEMEAYQGELKDMYDNFIDRYDKCEELTRNIDKGLENTLFFEFSRDITKFTDHPDDIRGVMLCSALIADALETINIEEILEAIK